MSEAAVEPVVRAAKEIPDDLFIQAVAECSKQAADDVRLASSWTDRMAVQRYLEEHLGGPVPPKVVLAKARALIKKGRMHGCPCGCRGDFDLRGLPDDPFVTPPE